MFPSILIQLEGGPNESYFYLTNKNGNISPGAVTKGSFQMDMRSQTELKSMIETLLFKNQLENPTAKTVHSDNFPLELKWKETRITRNCVSFDFNSIGGWSE